MPAPPQGGTSWNGAATNTWPSTIWELVQRSREGSADDRQRALGALLRQYYTPVSRFFKKALRVDDRNVEDLTQEFFTRFIEKDFLKNLQKEKSFRGFLKVACRRHFINWVKARNADKRSERRTVRLDETSEAVSEDQVDRMIDDELRAWYVEEAVERTRAGLTAQGREESFRIFEAKSGLRGDPPPDYKALAAEFGIPVFDVSNRLMAARKVFRQALVDLASERSPDPMEELRELGLSQYFI